MEESTYRKRIIRSIVKYLQKEGMELYEESSISNSIYLKSSGIKIRISDHVRPGYGGHEINVVTTSSRNQFITIINGGVITHNSLKDLKNFLKTTYEFAKFNILSTETLVDTELKKKSKRLNELKTDLNNINLKKDQARKTLKELENSISQLKRLKIFGETIDISMLSNKQKEKILKDLNNFIK